MVLKLRMWTFLVTTAKMLRTSGIRASALSGLMWFWRRSGQQIHEGFVELIKLEINLDLDRPYFYFRAIFVTPSQNVSVTGADDRDRSRRESVASGRGCTPVSTIHKSQAGC
jgi:hypothetical protein